MNAFLTRLRPRRVGVANIVSTSEHACVPRRGVLTPGLVALLCAIGIGGGLNNVVQAQDKDAPESMDMTIEELEAYIEKKKAVLEQVRSNRDITADKARKVQAALAEEEDRRAEALAEVEKLCQEQEALEPGSLEACMATSEEP